MLQITDEYKDKLKHLKFIDLFSGIGAFRIALESYGARCVYSVDNNKHATQTYDHNFQSNSYGDIREVNADDIPQFDILCAGFPCQSFSICGKQLGFEDVRGTLFFDILRITKYHRPKLLILENVANLKGHDKGRTFKTIKQSLKNLNYNVYYEILNASDFAIPQARKRIYIVCIRRDIDNYKFKFPKPINKPVCLKDILLDDAKCSEFIIKKQYILDEFKLRKYKNPVNKPIRVGSINKGAQGDRIYSINGHAITLSASGGGTGSKTGLYYVNGCVRKLHPREAARVMGFPDWYEFTSTTNQTYMQCGNSVVVDILQYILKEVIDNCPII